MKKLRCSPTAKAVAVLLLCVMALLFLVSLLCLVELNNQNAFSYGYEYARQNLLGSLGRKQIDQIRDLYFSQGLQGSEIFPNTNLRFSITLDNGKDLYSNYQGEEFLWSGTMTVTLPYPSWVPGSYDSYGSSSGVLTTPVVTPTPKPTPEPTPETTLAPAYTPAPIEDETFLPVPTPTPRPALTPSDQAASSSPVEDPETAQIHAYVLSDLSQQDIFSYRLKLFSVLYRLRYFAVVLLVLSFLIGVFLFLFLIGAAGYRNTSGVVTNGWPERIPYDLFTCLCMVLFFFPLMILFDGGVEYNILGFLLMAGMLLFSGLVLLEFCMSTAVRIKTRSLLSSCLSVRLFLWLCRCCRSAGAALLASLKNLPLIRRGVLITLVLFLLEFLLLAVTPSFDDDIALALILKDVLLLLGICWLLLSFRRLRDGAKALASGNLNARVSTDRLYFDMKDHAEDLNRIRDGMNAAVEERMKSERLRTELITNVSHDIKTPLTSIINYIDLLQKEEPQSETEQEYLDVLGRQSAKLKKLIEDLMEASKASTGNLPVNFEPCDLNVLMQQMLGEYEERFRAADLTPIFTSPEEAIPILADGRHMWRIFDNLLGNICKYAQPGTRVYLNTDCQRDRALVTFRNISREELNVSASELTERFTRGDSARSTDGNGLGLSIAESLTRLQGGEMLLTLDGDLFKVSLSFPLSRDNA